jgi:3-oxoacyl-[acyl-carrier-protein] synthase II
MAKQRRVVITGLGVCSPLGTGNASFWRSLLGKRIPLEVVDLFSTNHFGFRRAFQIKKTRFEKIFRYLKSAYLPRSAKFLLSAMDGGIRDSGFLAEAGLDKRAVGLFTSTHFGSGSASLSFYGSVLLKGQDNVDPLAFPPSLVNFSSSFACILYRFKGPNLTFSSGFQGGLEGIKFASDLIQRGIIKIAVVSGLNDLWVENFAQLDARGLLYGLSGVKGCRLGVLDSRRKGIILGENASTVILEDLDHAKKRRAKMYAEVLGYGVNFGKNEDAYAQTMESSLSFSGLGPADIDLCALNANGLKSLDAIELKALKRVFASKFKSMDVLAIKDNNGECEGASSVLQVLATAQAIQKGVLPPFACAYEEPFVMEGLKIRYKAVKKRIRSALINSFNLEGNNGSLVLREMPS